MRPVAILAMIAMPALAAPTLEELRNVPNLEKRAELALDHADQSISDARKAYDAQDDSLYGSMLDIVAEAVDLSYQSLKDTGKSARRSPKHFKRAELKMRSLLRRLAGLEQEVGFDYRKRVAAASSRVHATHEQILSDIMTKR